MSWPLVVVQNHKTIVQLLLFSFFSNRQERCLLIKKGKGIYKQVVMFLGRT
jgi:hypothetical protein